MRFRDTAVALRGPIRIHTQAARPSTVPRRTSPAVWACALHSQILPFLRPPPLRVSDFAQSAHVDPENQGTAAQGRPYPDFRNLCHLQLPSRAASLGGGCGAGARDAVIFWLGFFCIPKHLLRLVCLSMKTLAEITFPKGMNICRMSWSPNSCGRW